MFVIKGHSAMLVVVTSFLPYVFMIVFICAQKGRSLFQTFISHGFIGVFCDIDRWAVTHVTNKFVVSLNTNVITFSTLT